MDIRLEYLTETREEDLKDIDRSDVSEAYVDRVENILELHHYGLEHECLGRTFAVYTQEKCIGVLLLGEALHWDTDPPEMQCEPFYRLMGFVLDRYWRGRGIGSAVLEEAIRRVYDEFGTRPIALGVHKENTRAAAFYLRHGFVKTSAMEGEDEYYLRYPCKEK